MVGTHNRFAGVLSVDVDDLAVGRKLRMLFCRLGSRAWPASETEPLIRTKGFKVSNRRLRKVTSLFFAMRNLTSKERG